jgi:hypothetical protein
MDRQLGVEWREQWQAIQREESLKKYFKNLEVEDIPNDLPELSERLFATGYDAERIPEHITTPEQFDEWLASIETDEPDLDAWFGRDER